jgi:hypothetical protein
VVTAGSRDFEAKASQSMATNIGKIGIANVRRGNGFVWRSRPRRFRKQRVDQRS